MLLKPNPKTIRYAWFFLSIIGPIIILLSFLFFGDSQTPWDGLDVVPNTFMFLFILLLFQLALLPFLLSLNDSWEINGNELIHRFAYEVRRHDILKIQSFGPPFLYGRFKWFFRGERERHLISDDRVVDRMRFPYIYSKYELEEFFSELKRINPHIALESKLAKKFWTWRF